MKNLSLLIALTVALSACAPSTSTSLRAFFTGKPSDDQVLSLLETVVNRSGGSVFACPYDLAADIDPRYRHLCAKMPGDFPTFQATFEGNLIKTANETNGYVERLLDGWKRSNNFVHIGFFALNSRQFNVVYGPNPDGQSGSVVFEVDQLNL
jgi:hypothetical protein